MQEEIEAKANQDRVETNKIFKDLIDSSNRMNYQLRQSSPYSFRNQLPVGNVSSNIMRASPVNLDGSISGNIRLESNFTRFGGAQQSTGSGANNFQLNNANKFNLASPSPIRKVDQSNDEGSGGSG